MNLKRCPFCGSSKLEFVSGFLDNSKVYCSHCRSSGPEFPRQSDALSAWNARKLPPNTLLIEIPPVDGNGNCSRKCTLNNNNIHCGQLLTSPRKGYVSMQPGPGCPAFKKEGEK